MRQEKVLIVIRIGALMLLGLAAGIASAECRPASLDGRTLVFDLDPPEPPDPALRPNVPDCLRGLASPDQENCPRDDLAAFAEEVEIWAEALNRYVTDTNRFANEAAVFANSAVDYAQRSRQFADDALDFAKCEASELVPPGAQ